MVLRKCLNSGIDASGKKVMFKWWGKGVINSRHGDSTI